MDATLIGIHLTSAFFGHSSLMMTIQNIEMCFVKLFHNLLIQGRALWPVYKALRQCSNPTTFSFTIDEQQGTSQKLMAEHN